MTAVNGIWQYTGTDEASPAPALLNKLGDSVRNTRPIAFAGEAITDANGAWTIALPAGRFTTLPEITAAVISSTQIAIARVDSRSTTTITGHVHYWAGSSWAVTSGFGVMVIAMAQDA